MNNKVPRAGDIYLIYGVVAGICRDARPCVILQVHRETALVAIISSQLDLAGGYEITLLKSDTDFAQSGLTKDSFLPDVPEQDMSLERVERSVILGRAVGEFRRKIEAWFGVSFSA